MDYGLKTISDYLATTEEDKDLIKGIEGENIRIVLAHKSLMAMVHDGNVRLLSFLCRSDNLIKILTVATTPASVFECSPSHPEDLAALYSDESACAGIRSLIEAAPSKFCVSAATNKEVLRWARESVTRTSCIAKLALKRGVADEATAEFSKAIYKHGRWGVSEVPTADTMNSICEHIAEHHYCCVSGGQGSGMIGNRGTSAQGADSRKGQEDDTDSRDPDSVKILVRSLLSRRFNGVTSAHWLCDVARGITEVERKGTVDISRDSAIDVAEAFNSLSLLLLSTHRQLENNTLYSAWLEPWESASDNTKAQFPLTRESLRFAVISARLIATRWGIYDEDQDEYKQRMASKQSAGLTQSSQVRKPNQEAASGRTNDGTNAGGADSDDDEGVHSPKLERTDDVSEPSADLEAGNLSGYDELSEGANGTKKAYSEVLRSVPFVSPIDAGRMLQHIIQWVARAFDSIQTMPARTLLSLVSSVCELASLPNKTIEFNRANKIMPPGALSPSAPASADFFYSSFSPTGSSISQLCPESLLIPIRERQNTNLKSPTLETNTQASVMLATGRGKNIGDGEELADVDVLLNDTSIPPSGEGGVEASASSSICQQDVSLSNSVSCSTSAKPPFFSINTVCGTAQGMGRTLFKVPPASPLRILVLLRRLGVVGRISNLIFGGKNISKFGCCSILHSAFVRVTACFLEFAGVLRESNDVVRDVLRNISKYNSGEGNEQSPEVETGENTRKPQTQYLDSMCRTLIRLITLTAAGECVADEVVASIATLSDIGYDNPLLMSSSGRNGIVGSEVGGASWSGNGTGITLYKVQGNGLFEGVPMLDVAKEVRERASRPNTNTNLPGLLNTPVTNQAGRSATTLASATASASASISSIMTASSLNAIGTCSGVADTTLGVLLERLQKKRKQNTQARCGSAGSTSFTFSTLGGSLGRGSGGLNINVSDIGYAASSGTLLNATGGFPCGFPVVSSSAVLEIIGTINNEVAAEEEAPGGTKREGERGETLSAATGPTPTPAPTITTTTAATTIRSTNTGGRRPEGTPVFDTLLQELIIPDEMRGCRFDSSVVSKNTSLREAEEMAKATIKSNARNPMRPFDGKVKRSRAKTDKGRNRNKGDKKTQELDDFDDFDGGSSSSLSFTSSSSSDPFSGDDDFTPISDPRSSDDYSTSEDNSSDDSPITTLTANKEGEGNTRAAGQKGRGEAKRGKEGRAVAQSIQVVKKRAEPGAGTGAGTYFDELLDGSDDDNIIFNEDMHDGDRHEAPAKQQPKRKNVVVKPTDDWNFDGDENFKPEPKATGGSLDGEGDFQTGFDGGFQATFDAAGGGFDVNFGENFGECGDDLMGYDFKFEPETEFAAPDKK